MNEMDSFNQRLLEYLNYKGLKPSSLEKKVGLSDGLVSKALREKRHLGSDKIWKIFQTFQDLNPTWLFKAQGEMLLSAESEQNMVAEEMAVYIKQDMHSRQLLDELRTLSTTQRMRQLVDLVDEAISRAALDNAELKNKIIMLYENRDKLIEKLDKLL